MEESSEARRKRLKALSQSAAEEGGSDLGSSGGGGSSGAALANPFAEEDAGKGSSGPFTFFRCAGPGYAGWSWS